MLLPHIPMAYIGYILEVSVFNSHTAQKRRLSTVSANESYQLRILTVSFSNTMKTQFHYKSRACHNITIGKHAIVGNKYS